MEITINQKLHQVTDNCTIAEMLNTILSGEARGIAVSVNQTIVTKSKWIDHILKDGDRILLIKATQGG